VRKLQRLLFMCHDYITTVIGSEHGYACHAYDDSIRIAYLSYKTFKTGSEQGAATEFIGYIAGAASRFNIPSVPAGSDYFGSVDGGLVWLEVCLRVS